MTWHEEMLAWSAEPEPPVPGQAAVEWRAVSERIAADRLAKRGRKATAAAIEAEMATWPKAGDEPGPGQGLTAEETAEVARRDRERREEPPPALGVQEPPWNRGASTEEILAFGLSECTCGTCPSDNRPDGSSIPLTDDEEIRRLLAVGAQRMESSPTRWLETYAEQLVAELQMRRGRRR